MKQTLPFKEEWWDHIRFLLINHLNCGCCIKTIDAFSNCPNFFENWLIAEFVSVLKDIGNLTIKLNSNFNNLPKVDIRISCQDEDNNEYNCIIEVKHISTNSPNAKKRLFHKGNSESSVINDYRKLQSALNNEALFKIIVLYGPAREQHSDACNSENINSVTCVINKLKEKTTNNISYYSLQANGMFLFDISVDNNSTT